MTARSAGLLLPLSSLPGPYGIGDLGCEAERFLGWAESAGQTLWQVLPLGPTGHHDSPYGAMSAFAGNPLLVSPERLREEGFLPDSALSRIPRFPEDRVDYASVRRWKEKLFRLSWEHFLRDASAPERGEFEAFRASPEQARWLPDWALFSALKAKLGGTWSSWSGGLSRRRPDALARASREFADVLAYHAYLQFLFFRQWEQVKAEANRRGIAVMADVPIYLLHDSADAWVHPELFTLDSDFRPKLVAGVPPDDFSPAGQLWGYPLYRWDRMEEEGFNWWVARIRMNFRIADIVRLDHFRGFVAYWAVPASEREASNGQWMPGPGRKLFRALGRMLGEVPLVAEDLGTITEDVRELLRELGIPGMKVLQFAFSEDDSLYLPHRHVSNAVVYTGTHDNDTTRGWFENLGPPERERILHYLGCDGREIEWALIRAAYASAADRAIVPLQDVFGLGSEARMNTPGKAEGNWSWRARREGFRPELAARLRRLAELTGRC